MVCTLIPVITWQIKYGFDYLHKDEPHPKMVVEVMVIMYSILFILRIAAFVFSYC